MGNNNKAFKKVSSFGRPTTLTPQITKMICDALELGSYLESAAAYAGVHKTTLHKWLFKGRKVKKGLYADFVSQVDMAIEKSEVRKIQRINKAAETGDWRADAWMLERKLPKRWGRKETVRLEDDDTNSKDSLLTEESVNHVIARQLDKMGDERWDDTGKGGAGNEGESNDEG